MFLFIILIKTKSDDNYVEYYEISTIIEEIDKSDDFVVRETNQSDKDFTCHYLDYNISNTEVKLKYETESNKVPRVFCIRSGENYSIKNNKVIYMHKFYMNSNELTHISLISGSGLLLPTKKTALLINLYYRDNFLYITPRSKYQVVANGYCSECQYSYVQNVISRLIYVKFVEITNSSYVYEGYSNILHTEKTMGRVVLGKSPKDFEIFSDSEMFQLYLSSLVINVIVIALFLIFYLLSFVFFLYRYSGSLPGLKNELMFYKNRSSYIYQRYAILWGKQDKNIVELQRMDSSQSSIQQPEVNVDVEGANQ